MVKAAGAHPSLLGWIGVGMDHIYDGRDHISFVLVLLLVVMLVRTGETWDTRRILPTLKSTATVITAFTVAHSISLIAASLGWLDLPSRMVESLIALSIAYTAAENIVHPDVRWRFVLTFGFGLIHGLGFASVLSELLPPKDVIVPLLCFNVGVELGQLTIVAVALPVFYLLARVIGAWRYREHGDAGAVVVDLLARPELVPRTRAWRRADPLAQHVSMGTRRSCLPRSKRARARMALVACVLWLASFEVLPWLHVALHDHAGAHQHDEAGTIVRVSFTSSHNHAAVDDGSRRAGRRGRRA